MLFCSTVVGLGGGGGGSRVDVYMRFPGRDENVKVELGNDLST